MFKRYRPETLFRTYGTYVRTDKGDAICPPPITNGGGIQTGGFSLVGNYLRPSNNYGQLIYNINAVVLILIIC